MTKNQNSKLTTDFRRDLFRISYLVKIKYQSAFAQGYGGQEIKHKKYKAKLKKIKEYSHRESR